MSLLIGSQRSGSRWSPLDPANVSPFVACPATEDCPVNGRVFLVIGGEVALFQPWVAVDSVRGDGR